MEQETRTMEYRFVARKVNFGVRRAIEDLNESWLEAHARGAGLENSLEYKLVNDALDDIERVIRNQFAFDPALSDSVPWAEFRAITRKMLESNLASLESAGGKTMEEFGWTFAEMASSDLRFFDSDCWSRILDLIEVTRGFEPCMTTLTKKIKVDVKKAA